MNVAIIRGKFLNRYEMQLFAHLPPSIRVTAFGSLTSYHDRFPFPIVKLPSPMDLPDFPYKLPILNRLLVDAHYLWGLEGRLGNFDLVHSAETYYHYTNQCLEAKRKGYVKKVIATVLENIPFNNEGIRGRKAFKARARRELDHIIALTQRAKQALILEGADPAKITVIGHAIDTEVFSPAPGLQQRLGDPKRRTSTILFCGRLEAYKGVYELLYAYKLLVTDPALRPYTLKLRIIGDGSGRRGMVEAEKRLGLERYIEHRTVAYDRMPGLYRDADIYVAPSKATDTWQEQYNTTLLEAQACGLPIVTTQSGGIPENVGDAAMLVEPADTVSLATALRQFILNPSLRVDFGRRARARALLVHDAERVARRMAQLYKEILSS